MAESVTIGVLALQGAFLEHLVRLRKLSVGRTIETIEVRTQDDLALCDALIIPGGESTTMAVLARVSGLLEPLRAFTRAKPVWGTCAGAILLSQAAEGVKKGGQDLLGGVDVKVARNGWGSQLESFEAPLEVQGMRDPQRPFTGVFIRAPVVLELLKNPSSEPITVLAQLPKERLPALLPEFSADEATQAIVALRQGRHLFTTFHPELTKDDRFHEYFVRECVLLENA